MFSIQAWSILLLALLGNCGFWLFCFNRLNATGFPRKITKVIEKSFIAACFLIPACIALFEWRPLSAWLLESSGGWWPAATSLFHYYGAWCVASAIVLGAIWLESRRCMFPPRHLLSARSKLYLVDELIEGGSIAKRMTAVFNALPGNQITDLDVSEKELQLARSIPGIDGLRIGHISDLHFTGQYRPEHYHFVIDRLLELQPDLIAISGDIIDYDKCLPWIESILGRLRAPIGCAFVLGNHDCRLSDVPDLARRLTELGHLDVGTHNHWLSLPGGGKIQLLGNERPWHNRRLATQPTQLAGDEDGFRLGLTHSPDQFGWARRREIDLLLAGHTHGGQVRPPGIGPLVSPSWHGSRYASGVFFRSPTLMHVSRGVAGTHPLRWWCPTEISVLTIRDAPDARKTVA